MIGEANSSENPEGRGGKRLKNRVILALVAAVFVLFAAFTGVMIYSTAARQLVEQLDLGNRYLEEMNYEQAEVAFMKSIEIGPMSVDAYLGLAETYIREGGFEKALETARKGYETTGDERLREKADMIESGQILMHDFRCLSLSEFRH